LTYFREIVSVKQKKLGDLQESEFEDLQESEFEDLKLKKDSFSLFFL
jgi:hypothetical protein